jgi:UDP-N-acetylmuramoyl-L-alanyl-D-glutamate--2,6-diaminopimelate ligase
LKQSVTFNDIAALFPKAVVYGKGTAPITGICRDSRAVHAGDLFVCIRGGAHDSHHYIHDALSAGAAGIVVNSGVLEESGAEIPDEKCVIEVTDTRAALPIIACKFYGNPSHSLQVIGVTGTNGKTTTTRMVAAILRASGLRVGTIGTLGAELDGCSIDSEHTTPESDQLQRILAQMRDQGADAVVMEVSSHAIAQHRTDGIAFNAAIFCNLTQDHLDFHGTMEKYFETKAQLFSRYPVDYPRPDGTPFVAAITVSQWEGRELVTLARGDIITFSTDDSPAVLHAEEISLSPETVSFRAMYDSGIEKYDFNIDLPIGGAFQVGNSLGAISACLRLGVPRQIIADGLAALPAVPGRFESVPVESSKFSVIVDYAHTPDGLENLLTSARDLDPARIIVVFGCGGDRDKTKRPIMGRIAATLADIAVVTSDNPRNERPDDIISDILLGVDQSEGPGRKAEIIVQPNRRSAISTAINMARERDMVLIAGKGHETYQIVGDTVLEFDDCKVARELLSKRDPN